MKWINRGDEYWQELIGEELCAERVWQNRKT